MPGAPADSNLSADISRTLLDSKDPLNFGISIYSPVSIVSGSATFYFLQPIFKGKVFASAAILIAAQIFLFFVDRIWGHEIRTNDSVQAYSANPANPPTDPASPPANLGLCPSETSDTPLAVGLSVWSDFTDQPFSPSVFLLIPLFTLSNIRGSLPILILELLTTIFVRSVVPPQTTGSQTLPDPTPNKDMP